jgi:hypothetical protein
LRVLLSNRFFSQTPDESGSVVGKMYALSSGSSGASRMLSQQSHQSFKTYSSFRRAQQTLENTAFIIHALYRQDICEFQLS